MQPNSKSLPESAEIQNSIIWPEFQNGTIQIQIRLLHDPLTSLSLPAHHHNIFIQGCTSCSQPSALLSLKWVLIMMLSDADCAAQPHSQMRPALLLVGVVLAVDEW